MSHVKKYEKYEKEENRFQLGIQLSRPNSSDSDSGGGGGADSISPFDETLAQPTEDSNLSLSTSISTSLSTSSSVEQAPHSSTKRMMRLVRNREAAKKNRMKKKDWILNLQAANRDAKEMNSSLKRRVEELEKEFYRLQTADLASGSSVPDAPLVDLADIAPSAN